MQGGILSDTGRISIRTSYVISGALCPPLKNELKEDDKPVNELQETDEPATESVEEEENKINVYRAPEGGCVEYVVDRTPGEVAEEILASNTTEDEEGHETDSTTPEEDEESTGHADGGDQQGNGGVSIAGGGSGGAGKGGAKGGGGDDRAADIPAYWRGSFVPLREDEVQALELAKGSDAVVDYLDKRYVHVRRVGRSSFLRHSVCMVLY